MLQSGTFLLLLTSVSCYHVRNLIRLQRSVSQVHQSPAEISFLSEVAPLAIDLDLDTSSSAEGADDDLDLHLIDGMGKEMMELIVEAATLKPLQTWTMPDQGPALGEANNESAGGLKDISFIMAGLTNWKLALLNGHLPEFDHLDVVSTAIWPDRLLFEELSSVCNNLELPFLTSRHPELIPSVLRGLLEVSINYSKRIIERNKKIQEEDETNNKVEDENDPKFWEQDLYEENLNGESDEMLETTSEGDFEAALASSLASQFASAWAPPLGGLSSLDDLYGPGHGLLSPGGQEDVGGGAGAGKGGFGLFDGIWQHTGWVQINEIQKQLKEMHELRDLVRSLGRRPSVNGTEMRKTQMQIEARSAPRGVGRSSFSPHETTGIQHSDTIEGLLPSEMMLLARHLGDSPEDREARKNGERKRRLLFLAKRAKKLLGSYEKTGWTDQLSRPKKKPRTRFQTLPTSPGGPIIVCLDTSWSMAGPRENLAKAVVLECSKQASKQHRACHILAFSGGGNIKDFEIPPGLGKKEGFVKLLSFLGGSFKGGTDICSPLIRGSELVGDNIEWAGADLLMVTDGELQNPPVPKDVLSKLARMEVERGLEIHGLLVGRNTSVPLSLICTDWDGVDRVHNFLCKYDPFNVLKESTSGENEDMAREEYSYGLGDAYPYEDDDKENDNDEMRELRYSKIAEFKSLSDQLAASFGPSAPDSPSIPKGPAPHTSKYDKTKPKLKSKTRLFALPHNIEGQETKHSPPITITSQYTYGTQRPNRRNTHLYSTAYDTALGGFDYLSILKSSQKLAVLAVEKKEKSILESLLASKSASGLDESAGSKIDTIEAPTSENEVSVTDTMEEKSDVDADKGARHEVQGPYRNLITTSLSVLGNGLIEREVEVKLLLLSVLCKEHVLLLGPPGTGKSELGRRLASMGGGGIFFERLLTKYSNPEELFGPLSLSALERDEYIRNTDGYLPTASVAFLDEIFKANSAILNSLLTILNERRFDNGKSRQIIPLLAVVAASNELPESEELDALYDRFLFRRLVSPVSDTSIKDLLTAGTGKVNGGPTSTATATASSESTHTEAVVTDELTSSLLAAASSTQLSSEVIFLLRDIRAYMRDEMDPPVYCSDRRLVKAAAMLRTVAATHGKTSVSLLDCLLLQHVLWYHPDDQKAIRDWLVKRLVPETGLFGLEYFVENVQKRIVSTYMNKFQDTGKMFNSEANLNNFLTNNEYMREILSSIENEKGKEKSNVDKDKEKDKDSETRKEKETEKSPDKFYSTDPTLNSLYRELTSIMKVLIKKITDYQALARDCRGSSKGGVGFDHLWLSDVEAISCRQNTAPRLDSAVKDIERLLVVVISIREVMKFALEGAESVADSDVCDTQRESSDITDPNTNTPPSTNGNSNNYRVISDLSKIDMIQEIWSKYKSKGAPATDFEEVKLTGDTGKSGSSKKKSQKQIDDEADSSWSDGAVSQKLKSDDRDAKKKKSRKNNDGYDD